MSGTELMRIANLNTMEVRVNVNENDIIRVSPGDTASIEVDSYTHQKEKFKGVVTQISSTANETMNLDQVTDFEVKIRILRESYFHLLKNELKFPSPFRPGMTASVEIVTERKHQVLSVPVTSVTIRSKDELMEEEEKESRQVSEKANEKPNAEKDKKGKDEVIEIVFVNENGKANVQEVKTGISDDNNIEILSGLKEGMSIVEGPYNVIAKVLKNGTMVKEKEKKGKGGK
ncbi:MAG: hypothetical protein A3H98_03950 [Bacteroidetes bacterium RIFCSPLOWO2_02_FULL_36_8]|nr:MAG: hypothetical protein A3H98_03950 [Bacteroidetes bacterium RIFCSPLOWO2_02_FULL_36_8]